MMTIPELQNELEELAHDIEREENKPYLDLGYLDYLYRVNNMVLALLAEALEEVEA